MTTRAIDGWQGFVALLGITLGVIPLVLWAFGDRAGGLWGLVLDEPGWLPPLLAVVLGVALLVGLERLKRRG